MKQLDSNFSMIEKNLYFENRNRNVSQLKVNLSSSVKEQYKASLSTSYAAKYARIWLEKVRKRKQERELTAMQYPEDDWEISHKQYTDRDDVSE